MPQSKILLDSNTYFRLAKNIHPLLDVEFSDVNYCLYVLKELDHEHARSPRLRSAFSWVDDDEYTENRKKRLTQSKKQRREIQITIDFLKQHKLDNALGVSHVDIVCLSTAHVLNIPVVTDDGDMIELASTFAIQVMKTQDLMHLMLNCGLIDMAKVRQIAAWWTYMRDKPLSFRADYIRLFREDPP